MSKFEILCVTMHQNDFSKIREMNIHSNVVFANQTDVTAYAELDFDGHTAKMISTQTRGVGINRNLAFMHASADICMLADDDVKYVDDMEERVVSEFEAHPDADIIIFNFDTDDNNRRQKIYNKTKKYSKFARMPWATFRIAVRLQSVRNNNIWFTTLFGGGCKFPSGEDSMWLNDARKCGLTFYVSKEVIGKVSFEVSSWFTGYDEKFFWGKGAYYQAVHPKSAIIWMIYFAYRTFNMGTISCFDKIKWMMRGKKAYRDMICYEDYQKTYLNKRL